MTTLDTLMNQTQRYYETLRTRGDLSKQKLLEIIEKQTQVNLEIRQRFLRGERMKRDRKFDESPVSLNMLGYCFQNYGNYGSSSNSLSGGYSPFQMLQEIRKLEKQAKQFSGQSVLRILGEQKIEQGVLEGKEPLYVNEVAQQLYLAISRYESFDPLSQKFKSATGVQGLLVPSDFFSRAVSHPDRAGLLGAGEKGAHWRLDYWNEPLVDGETREEFHLYFGDDFVNERIRQGFERIKMEKSKTRCATPP